MRGNIYKFILRAAAASLALMLAGVLAAPSSVLADEPMARVGLKEKPAESQPAFETTIVPAPAPKEDLPLRITSDKYLDYDEESNFIYGRSRTKVWYRDIYLEADRLMYDVRLNEVQAYGNIIMKKGTDDEYTADSVWYSFEKGRGHARGGKGRHGDFYIIGNQKEQEEPSFELLSQDDQNRPRESVLRNSSYSTCDFPVPHYRVRGTEILLYPNDRVFIRSATLYVWEIPVMYWPAYTSSLVESSPWSFILGYNSKLGGYMRVGYEFRHSEYEPKDDVDEVTPEDIERGRHVFTARSKGKIRTHADYFTKRGFGYGATYTYRFDYKKHQGIVDLYQFHDRKFEAKNYSSPTTVEDDTDFNRWIARIQHRSKITEEIQLQVDVDEMSDPDIYYDILDRFNNLEKRYRVPERNIKAALTYRKDQYVGRLLFEMRHRIGRDRVTDYTSPFDNDADYNIDPYRRREVDDEEGFRRKRYGRVSERAPQFTFSTNYYKLGGTPLYTYSDVNIFNNLDKGLNAISKDDNAWVRGIDVYQALLYRLKFSPRYTLTARVGVGGAFTDRSNEDFNYDFPTGIEFPYTLTDLTEPRGGVTFVDEDTILAGTRKRSIQDIKDYYAYADAMLYFHARFTDYLHGWIRYNYRYGTDDSIGEFYESLGNKIARHDLYNFRLPEHWVRAGLNYFLRYPNLSAYFNGGYNLQGDEDIYANEERYYVGPGVVYTNNAKTFKMDVAARYTGRQAYDTSDVRSKTQDFIYGILNAQYIPRSRMWWSKISVSGHKAHDRQDYEPSDYGFDEYGTEFRATGTLGARVGPKYDVETRVTYRKTDTGSGVSDISLIIKRDLHDFVAHLRASMERDIDDEHYDEKDNDDDEDKEDWQYDFQFSLAFKKPFAKTSFGAPTISTLADVTKQAEVAGQEARPVRVGD